MSLHQLMNYVKGLFCYGHNAEVAILDLVLFRLRSFIADREMRLPIMTDRYTVKRANGCCKNSLAEGIVVMKQKGIFPPRKRRDNLRDTCHNFTEKSLRPRNSQNTPQQ